MPSSATDQSVFMILSNHTEAFSNTAANINTHNERITKLEEDITALSGSGSTLTGENGISIINDVITIDFSHSGFNTDIITESTNLYYTDARARSAISVSGDLTYNNTTGEISFTSTFNQVLNDLSDLTITNVTSGDFIYYNGTTWVNVAPDTSHVSEHTSNLYYTNARVLDTLNNAESVGIGTANPSNSLHVNSGITNIAAQFESTDATGGIMLKDSSGNVELTTSGTHGFDIRPNGGAAVFRVEGNGYVGIGQNSPLDLLHITSSDNDARVVVQGATGFDAEVKFFEGLNVKNTIGWDSASSQFRIGTANVDTNVSFCINSSRNIGIGTTDPSVRLDVNGVVKGKSFIGTGGFDAGSEGSTFGETFAKGEITTNSTTITINLNSLGGNQAVGFVCVSLVPSAGGSSTGSAGLYSHLHTQGANRYSIIGSEQNDDTTNIGTIALSIVTGQLDITSGTNMVASHTSLKYIVRAINLVDLHATINQID